jgi:chitinase
MYVSLNQLGSMILDVAGDRLDATFLRENGTRADSFTIQKAPANAPPTVSLTSPANGAAFVAPASIALAATAADTDGTVARVDFYSGTTLLGSDTAAPFEFAWSGVPAGSYLLTAKAIDDDGATTTSAAIGITVTSAAPAAPSGLSAVAVSASQINLAWADNSGDEGGFKVERSTDGVTYTQIAVVGANVTAYSSTGLARNKSYRFRVRATGPGGDSAYSNVASAKTLRK